MDELKKFRINFSHLNSVGTKSKGPSFYFQGLIDAHAQFKATLGEADKEFNAIIALIHECESFAKQYNVPGATINPYTNLTGAQPFTICNILYMIQFDVSIALDK